MDLRTVSSRHRVVVIYTSVVEDHEEDIKEFQKEAAGGRDPNAQAFAKATLPTLQAHLEKIRAIAMNESVKAG
jgi:hypothetical protein